MSRHLQAESDIELVEFKSRSMGEPWDYVFVLVGPQSGLGLNFPRVAGVPYHDLPAVTGCRSLPSGNALGHAHFFLVPHPHLFATSFELFGISVCTKVRYHSPIECKSWDHV